MKALRTIAILSSLAVSSVAFAGDAVGTPGTVAELEVNTTSADIYLQYFGRVVISSSTSKNSSTSTEYRWGGTSCGSRVLPDSMVAMLQHALESGTPILPRYQDGQGSTKCIVGFKIAQ
jgi:hypothetical protein